MAGLRGSGRLGRVPMRWGGLALLLFIAFSSCQGSGVNSQKALPQDTLPKSKYRALEFMADDKPSIALIDTSYKNFNRKKAFPLSVFITVTTVDKNDKGHPTAKESAVFNSIEDQILAGFSTMATCYIGKTTMDGYRDMIFYISEKDQEKVSSLLGNVQKKFPRIKAYTFEKDPEWEAVEEFYKALDKVK